MAKKAKYHDRDRIATNYLRNLFSTKWLFKNPRDGDSGREYSEDWIIEIVHEDEEPTGIEFGIQNKTNPKITKSHASVTFDTDDIKRLLSLRRPVLIHAHHIKSTTSYWIWFSDWYVNNYNQEQDNQKTVTVKIPLTNILDEAAVKTIKATATWDHRKRDAEKRAEFTNMRHGKDFRINVQSDDTSISMVINPLHEEAIPTIVPLDEKAQQSIIHAIETGETIALAGKFAIEGVPYILHEGGKITVEAARIWTHQSKEVSFLRIEYLGEDDVILFKTGILQTYIKQQGTKFIWREAVDQKNWTTYKFVDDDTRKTSSFDIKFECKSRDAIEFEKFLALLDLVRPVKKFKFTYLNTDPEQVTYRDAINFFNQELSPNDKAIRLIVKALALVQTKLTIPIQVPEKLSNELLHESALIVQVILQGNIPLETDEFYNHYEKVTESPEGTHEILSTFEQYGYLDLHLIDHEQEINTYLAGQRLSLGIARPVLKVTKILNVDELKKLLSQGDISEDTKLQLELQLDRSQGIWQFKDWPQEDEETH